MRDSARVLVRILCWIWIKWRRSCPCLVYPGVSFSERALFSQSEPEPGPRASRHYSLSRPLPCPGTPTFSSTLSSSGTARTQPVYRTPVYGWNGSWDVGTCCAQSSQQTGNTPAAASRNGIRASVAECTPCAGLSQPVCFRQCGLSATGPGCNRTARMSQLPTRAKTGSCDCEL